MTSCPRRRATTSNASKRSAACRSTSFPPARTATRPSSCGIRSTPPEAYLPFLLRPVKVVEDAVQDRRHDDAGDEQEHQAGVEGVQAGENLAAVRPWRIHGP